MTTTQSAPPRLTKPVSRPRVAIADDSALMRRLLGDVLQANGIEVVGRARDGDEALALCMHDPPQVMTLDLQMPGMGGLEVLRTLRARRLAGPHVIVVSAFSAAHGAQAVDALAEGAFDLVQKPAGRDDLKSFEFSLLEKIRLAITSVRALPRRRPAAPATPFSAPHRSKRAVVIATSTGGPRALAALLPELPGAVGLGTLIVQHMPPGFTASLAARLDRASALTVRESSGSETLDPGVALIAPGGRHLRLGAAGRTVLSDAEPIGRLRPRADLLINDAAARYRDRLLLVVLSGMGNDGLAGAREVKRLGGRVLVEAEETCTVYGMPRAVLEAGLADEVVVPLNRMAQAVRTEAGR